MIMMILAAATFVIFVFGAYFAGKYIGRENGYYEGHSEAYREVERLIDDYIENLNKEFDAKDTPTKGA